MKKPVVQLLAIVSLVFIGGISACGGSGGSCGKVQPCGGSPTGSWKISNYCVNNNSSAVGNTSCTGATTDLSALSETGTFSFTDALTYQQTAMLSGSLKINYPPGCLTNGTTTLTCADVDAQFQAIVTLGTDFQAASCSGASTCTCTLTLTPQTITRQGTYQTTGTNLTLMASDGSTDGGAYCVQGDTLHLITVGTTMNMGTMGAVTIDSDILLTKN